MAQIHTISLFSFSGIHAALHFIDYDACIGTVVASGFDAGGACAFANIACFDEDFYNQAACDRAIANAMNFVSTEMLKQAAWRAT